jgi:hypothetical protein
MKTALVLVVLGGFLAATMLYSVRLWHVGDGTALGVNGWVALTLGVIATFAVGAGLMWLVFHSSRKGYDDRGRNG